MACTRRRAHPLCDASSVTRQCLAVRAGFVNRIGHLGPSSARDKTRTRIRRHAAALQSRAERSQELLLYSLFPASSWPVAAFVEKDDLTIRLRARTARAYSSTICFLAAPDSDRPMSALYVEVERLQATSSGGDLDAATDRDCYEALHAPETGHGNRHGLATSCFPETTIGCKHRDETGIRVGVFPGVRLHRQSTLPP